MADVAHLTRNGRSIQSRDRLWTAASAGLLDTLTASRGPLGAYLHVPFCFHKCHYCDFYSVVDRGDRHADFIDQLLAELQVVGQHTSRPIRTIFAGGGTPTLLSPDLWRRLLAGLDDSLSLTSLAEFTVEANPETVTAPLLEVLAAGGVNRLSIGAQSFAAEHLKTLERWHEPDNVARSVGLARAAGIDNFNLDLIFAIPGQTLPDWCDDLGRALELEPSHLSCYALTYEPNTPMAARLQADEFERADEDLEAAMYETTVEVLGDAGFEQYEISNWAKPSRACQHNLGYWTNKDWWAFGPGAAGHIDGCRWKNIPRLNEYLDGPAPPRIVDIERLDPSRRAGEALMLGLRLNAGVKIAELDDLLADESGESVQRRLRIDQAVQQGILECDETSLRLTPAGRLVADSLFVDLL